MVRDDERDVNAMPEEGRGALVAVALAPATWVASFMIAAVVVLITGHAVSIPWLPGVLSLVVLPVAMLAAGHRSPVMLGWALSAGALIALLNYAVPIAVTLAGALTDLPDYAMALALAEGIVGLTAAASAYLLQPVAGVRLAALITGAACVLGTALYVQPFVPMTFGVNVAQLIGLLGFQAALFLAGYSGVLTYAGYRRKAAHRAPVTHPAPQ